MSDNPYETRITQMGPHFFPDLPQKTLHEADLQEIELQLGHVLPPQYRVFLTYYGGVYFLDGSEFAIPWEYGGADANVFYGRLPGHSNDLVNNYESYRGRIPIDLLPIADNGGGSQICIGLTGERYGKIFYWDNRQEGLPQEYIDYNAPVSYHNVYLIADSFDAFFFSLRMDDEVEAE